MPPIATPVIAAPMAPPLVPAGATAAATVAALPAIEAGPREEQGQDGRRCRGTVKWFSDAKAYGFIRGDDGRDAFVHYSALSKAGLRTLTPGQIVEYEVQLTAKGLQAISVTHPGAGALR